MATSFRYQNELSLIELYPTVLDTCHSGNICAALAVTNLDVFQAFSLECFLEDSVPYDFFFVFSATCVYPAVIITIIWVSYIPRWLCSHNKSTKEEHSEAMEDSDPDRVVVAVPRAMEKDVTEKAGTKSEE